MDELIKQLETIAAKLELLKDELPGSPDENIIADELRGLSDIPHWLEMIHMELKEINTREDSKNF